MHEAVKRPQNTKIHRKGGREYVYVTLEKIYDPVKQYNVDKRMCIGVMNDSDMMIPNDRYYDLFPEERPLLEAPERSDCLSVGTFILLKQIMKDIGLEELLDEVYGKDSDLFKDVAAYMIIEESSTMQHFENYGFFHPTFCEKVCSDSKISEVFHKNSIARHDLFLEKWNNLHCDLKSIYISYDSTNMNSAAEGIDLLEYGHSKKQVDLPQINVSLGFDQNDLTPLFYETYPGSIVDKRQCQFMIDKARKYGYSDIGFILDRGYFTRENLDYLDDNDYDYICMALADSQMVQSALNECRYVLKEKSQYYLPDFDVQGMTANFKMPNKKGGAYVHVYYNELNAANLKRSLKLKFLKYEQYLDKLIESRTALKSEGERYRKFYTLSSSDGYLTGYKRKADIIDLSINNAGYFVIVTSKKMSAYEALDAYCHRDSTEKLFMMDKTFLDADAIRTHHDESCESKILTNFIALILRNYIFKKTKDLKKMSSKDYTVPSIIRQLEKMIITRDCKGNYSLRYQPTKKQKIIFSMFDISETKIKKLAQELCEQYSSKQKEQQ